jgi:hypothetical protein
LGDPRPQFKPDEVARNKIIIFVLTKRTLNASRPQFKPDEGTKDKIPDEGTKNKIPD